MNSPTGQPRNVCHVVAAVIVNAHGEVLVSRRHANAHQGGLWEFPGGKVEAHETALQALRRELHEELGIELRAARPLIRIPHQYPDQAVLLEVWRVSAFRGEAHGREGQPVQWLAPTRLREFAFPAANRPVVVAARLPDRYLITPEPGADFSARLERAFAAGIRLVQLRARTLPEADYLQLARSVCAQARRHGAEVLLNADPAQAALIVQIAEVGAAGVHLSAARLRTLERRPLPADLWLAASCHTADELAQAARIGCDFAVLGPVQATASHPGAPPLGWEALRTLTEHAALPVYALGGLHPADLEAAWQAGAQGIAAIRALWPEL
ncbi:MAG: Nudix family hydrolase [Gammaproteobacteria bacterium]